MIIALNLPQLIVGAFVALFYVPCAAVFPVLRKEFKIRYVLIIAFSIIIIAFIMEGPLNVVFTLLA